MKSSKKLKLFFVVAFAFVAMFSFVSLFGGINTTALANASGVTTAQTETLGESQTADTGDASEGEKDTNETTENNSSVDFSSYDSWDNYAEEPGTDVENLGSVSTSSKKVVCSTAAHLAWVAVQTNSGSSTYGSGFSGWTIELDSDINLGGKFWTPIGTSSNKFKGIFIGHGHKITGLTFETNSSAGLFGYNDGSKIMDVIIEDCINVSARALTYLNGTIYNSYSSSKYLKYDGAPNQYHSVSNGVAVGTNVTTSSGTPIGLNSLYYNAVYVYDAAGTSSGYASASEYAINQSFSSNKLTMSLDNAHYSVDMNYRTIDYIEILEYGFSSDRKSFSNATGAWTKRSTITFADDDEFFTMQKLSLSFNGSASNSQRVFPSDTSKNLSGSGTVSTTEISLGTVKYVHQCAVKVKVYLKARRVRLTHNAYAYSDSVMYSQAQTAYNATAVNTAGGEAITGANLKAAFTSGKTSGGASTSASGKTNFPTWIYYNNSITYTHSYGADAKQIGAVVNSTAKNWATSSLSVTFSSSNIVTNGNYLDSTVNVWLKNIHKYTLNNASVSLSSERVSVGTGTSLAYMVNYLSGETDVLPCDVFLHNLTNTLYAVSGNTNTNVINDVYITDSSATKTNSMGSSYVYSSGAIPGNSYASKSVKTATSSSSRAYSWSGQQDGGTLYCAWKLSTKTYTIKNDDTSKVTLTLQTNNPYTGTTTQTASNATASKTYTVYSTFNFIVLNANRASQKDKVFVATASASYGNNVRSGKDTKLVSITETSDSSLKNDSYRHYVKITTYQTSTYSFKLKQKEVVLKFDFLVQEGSTTIDTFTVINKSSGVKLTHTGSLAGVSSPLTLTYNSSCSPTSSSYTSPEYTAGGKLLYIGVFSVSWDYITTTSKLYRFNTIVSYSSKSLSYTGYNELADFSFSDPLQITDGETITIQIKITSYTNEFETGEVVYDIDNSNNTTFYPSTHSTFDASNTITQTLTIKVDYMEFNDIKLNGTKIYDVDGNEYYYKGAAKNSSKVVATTASGVTTLTLGDGGTITIKVEDRGVTGGTKQGQTVTITFSRLAYITGKYSVKVGYDKIKYAYQVVGRHYQKNCSGSNVVATGDTSRILWITYKDEIVYAKNATDANDVDVALKSNDTATATTTTYTFEHYDYFAPKSSIFKTVTAYSLLSKSLSPSQIIEFYPAGVRIEVIGRDVTAVSYEYVKDKGTFSKTGFGLTEYKLTAAVVDYYTFKYFTEKSTGTKFETKHTCGSNVLCPSMLSYKDLVDKYVKNGVATLYADYDPIIYGITFTDEKTVTLTYSDAVYKDDQTISDYLDANGYLTKFVKSGYDLVFVDKASGKEFSLNNTIQDIIKALAKPTTATGLTFTLVPKYTGKNIRFDFVLKGDVEVVRSYSTTYGADIDWEEVMDGLANELLEEKEVVVISWNEETKNPLVASYVDYNTATEVFTYSYTTWKPNWYQSVYKIVAEWNSASIKVIYDGTYLSAETQNETTVAFGTRNFKAVPTPERVGYEFVYWKAVDSEGNAFYAYELNSNKNSIVVTKDSELYFYAYWNVLEVEFEYGKYTGVYDAKSHKVEIVKVKQTICDMKNTLTLYKEGGTQMTATLLDGALTYSAKYVADSGKFYAVFTYDYVAADKTKANSKYYILNNLTTTTSEAKGVVTITPKQLEIKDEITKQYDNNNKVLQEIVGIFDADKSAYSITATYASVNAAENISVSYAVTCSNAKIKDSYAVPTTNKGDITPREIYAELSGSIKYSGLDDEQIVVSEGTFSDEGAVFTTQNATVTFTNEAYIATLLGASRTLAFKIVTIDSYIKTFDVDEFTAEVKESNGSVSTDFVIVIASSDFEIEDLEDDERSFMVYSVVHPDHPNVDTLNVADYVYSINMTGARRLNDLTFNIILSPLSAGDAASFAVAVDLKNANWWLNGALVIDRVTGEETLVSVTLYEDGTANFDYVVSANKTYDVYLQFTNISKITYELGYISASEMLSTPSETYVEYSSNITLPVPTRKGLTFNKWFYVDHNEQQTLVGGTAMSWGIKGDITLYALWTYTATITIAANNVSAVYSPTEYYTFSATNSNDTSNTHLEYVNYWQRAATLNGTYTRIEDVTKSITLHNVVDSGCYSYVFDIANVPVYLDTYPSISLNVTYVNNNKFSVSITRKALTLVGEINKQYDGESMQNYTIVASNVNSTYAELVGEVVVVTYAGAHVGANITSVVETADAVIAANYTLSASGKVIKRDVAIDIGRQEFVYTGNLISYTYGQELLDTIKINNIVITTISANVGEYTQANGNITITCEPVLLKNDASVSASYFNFIVSGSIVITEKTLLDEDVNIVWEKVYNMANQNVDVYVFGTKLSSNYTVTRNSKTFAGATEAGNYTNVTVTINYPNYKEYSVKNTFVISAYEVFVEILINNIYKVYDGDVKLTSLLTGENYKLYTSQSKEAEITAAHKTNVLGNSLLWFEFATPTAGKDKALSLKSASDNYKFTLINKNLKAEIAKKNITLSVSAISKIYDELAFEIAASYITPVTLVSGETISGKIKFAKVNAGTYALVSSAISEFDFAELMVGENPITTNYDITAVNGTATIQKASLEVVLNPDSYIYTGAVQDVKFKATRNSDSADVTNILQIAENTGIDVGTHEVVLEIKDDYANNYNYTQGTYEFTIIHKEINISVNAHKVYDGSVFTYYVRAHNDLLCVGHTFGDSTFVTAGSYADTYYSGLVIKNVTIYDASSEDVTGNYDISYNVTLTIGKDVLAEDDIIKSSYVYNNQVQTIEFEVAGDKISFRGNKTYGTTAYTQEFGEEGDERIWNVKFARKAGENSFSVLDFKYAATYTVMLTSNIYEDYQFEITITPKTITTFNASTTKVYDGTTEVIGGVTSDDIYAEDTKYVTLKGEYGAVFGSTIITVEFEYIKLGAEDDITAEVYELIKASYVLAENLSKPAEITKREVTFTYIGTDVYYYTGQKLTLNVASKFSISNVAVGESFSGSVDFTTIINAGTYSIASEIGSANMSGLTLDGNSIDYYKLTFVGTITINKAELVVQQALNISQVYSDEAKFATIVAYIYDARGQILAGTEQELLFATYKASTSGEYISAINAGEYYIYPQISETFASNYTYVGEEYLDEKLNILKRSVVVSANKEIVYDAMHTSYALSELDASVVDIVSGHTFVGTITIADEVYDLGTFVYKTGNVTDGVSLAGFAISNASGAATTNYEITYDIVIEIVETVGLGQFRAYAKQDYQYTSANQINDIVLVFEVGIASGVHTEDIEFDKQSNYAKIVGYYSSEDNARSATNALDEVKVIGTYYARVLVDVDGNGAFATEYCIAVVNVVKKVISKASLSYEGVAFIGVATYFNGSELILDSTDIYEVDKQDAIITATYYAANAIDRVTNVGSGYKIKLSLSGTSSSNYVFDTNLMDGSISKRVVVVNSYNDSDTYYYKGAETIVLTADKFAIVGQVSGHTLTGTVEIFVQNAGEYRISEGDISFGMASGASDVSSNYKIEVSQELIFTMNKAQITISWTAGDLTYNAQERLAEIIDSLTFEGSFKTGVKTDVVLTFNASVANVKDAGEYVISLATSTSGNFEYTISSDNKIVVNQKEISINLGMLEVKYKQYNTQGYNLNYDEMVSGGYPVDKALFEQSIYKIDGVHIANTTYYAEDGEDYVSGGKFVKYNKIATEYQTLIAKNYKVVSIVGGIKIIPENIVFEEIAPFTYNGQDRFSELVVVYSYDDGSSWEITPTDTTYGSITEIELRNAGEYDVVVIINTAIYTRKVTINAKAITRIDLNANKYYDGTNRVYNESNGVSLSSADVVTGDDIVITGAYEGFKASETDYAISFAKTGTDSNNYTLPNNYTGKILKRPITFDFGTKLVQYNASNSYELEYAGVSDITGGTITQNKIVFSLKENKVKNGLVLTTENANFDTTGFVIEKDSEVVTTCYDITFKITVNIDAKEFVVTINGFDGDVVEYDATEKKITLSISGLTEQEENIVLSNLAIVYSYANTGDTLATETYPIDADKYRATIVYSGSPNYVLAGDEFYGFEITPYRYEVEAEDIQNFSKEYNTQDPALTQAFTKTFASASHTFTITYARETGEEIGTYNLILSGNFCDSQNIEFVYDESDLADKFEIVKNTSDLVKITISKYNNGEFVRYYGLKNIGTFDIGNFTYTTKVNDNSVTAGITAGTIIYNSGNVGMYGINTAEISSTNFTRFEVVSEIQLEIKARTLLVSATNYNKPYDGTNTFVNELTYNYNSVAKEGTVDADDIAAFGEVVVAVVYAGADAGTHALSATLSTSINNFNVVLENTSGTIIPLQIEVQVEDVSVVYGEAIVINYNVDYTDAGLTKKFTSEQLKAFVMVAISTDGKLSSAGFAVVGEYAISARVNDNFEIVNTITQKVTVTPKQITVNVTPKIYKTQDGSTDIDLSAYTSVKIEGAFDADDVRVASANFTDANSALGKVVKFTLTGNDGANYVAKDSTGDIGQRLITFEFVYYGYEGCAVAGSQINSATIALKNISYDYYASITAQNPNSLPAPAFIGRGYEFVGWSLNTAGTKMVNPDEEISSYVTPYPDSGKVVVYAMWDIQKFDISIYKATYNFETNGYDKTLVATVRDYYLTEIDVSTDYAEDIAHYTYVGYGVGNTNKLYTTKYQIVDNASLYLVYDLNKYSVVFDTNGGVFSNQSSVFTYLSASTASISVYYGQTIGAVVAESILSKYTITTKVGYTFASWQIGANNYQVADIASYAVLGETTFVASWTANKYALTIYGVEGTFELTDTQITLGWTYTDASKQNITILVSYETNIPVLPIPSKDYYAFAGYVDSLGQTWSQELNTIWTATEGINLYATYSDLDYTLTIIAQNATVSLVVKDAGGAIVNVEDVSTETGKYVYNVKTSYSVTITALANAGYTFESFVDANSYGVAVDNTYAIASFTGNPEITINVTANSNQITLKVNDDAFGYIMATDGTNTYKSNDATATFVAKTGEEFIISQFANEGYQMGEWAVVGTGELVDFGEGRRAFIGFTSDATIYLEFTAKDLQVTINNTPEKGYYVYKDTTYTENQTITVKTGDEISLRITANYGYEVITTAFEFVTESTNKGTLQVEKIDGEIFVTLSGFTADGSVTISYKTQTFTLTFGYAEYDEETNEISPVANAGQILLVNGEEQSVGDTLTFEYLTEISIKAIYEKQGFKLYNYTHLQSGEFVGMVGQTSASGEFSFDLDYSYNIYLVYQREIYTVTYKVNNSKHGTIAHQGADEHYIEIVESVYYGRTTGAIEVNLADDYREFVGWTKNGTTVTTTFVISGQEITENTTFVAEMKGTIQVFNVVINANSTFEVLSNINEILSGTNVTIGSAGQTTDTNGNIVITIPVTYMVGDEITLELSVNNYYQVINGGAPSDDFVLFLGDITPAAYNDSFPYVINLSLRYYKIEVQTDAERAATFSCNTSNSIGIGAESNFNANGTTMLVAYIQYGGTLALVVEVQSGYTYAGQQGTKTFTMNGTSAVLENVTEELVIVFNFTRTQYKITFNTNYPTDCLGEPIENVSNKEFVFYVEQDGKVLKNADGSPADITALLASQVFENEINAKFAFEGWSITLGTGTINRTYHIDPSGIYYFDGETRVYGFNTCIAVDENNDNIPDLDANGRVQTSLYGVWSLPTYKITIEYAPSTITYEGDYSYYFQDALGLSMHYVDENSVVTDYLLAAEGVGVVMFTTPEFDGYRYYGWKLSTASEISTENIEFTMIGSEVSIILYYEFQVKVLVEESIAGANIATVNGQTEIWCIVGQTLSFATTAGEGFNFAYWKLDGAKVDELGATFTTEASNTAIYTAVFEGSVVEVILRNINHTSIELSSISANSTEETPLTSGKVRVGDTVKINIASVEYGYALQAISANDSTNDVVKDNSGTFYTYLVSQADGTSGKVYIDAVVNPVSIAVKFEINIQGAGFVIANNTDVSNTTVNYSYNDNLDISVSVQQRYNLIGVSINGTPIDLATSFVKTIHQVNGFVTAQTNVITFEFEKLYWVDVRQALVGYGTKEAPYLISSAENLAYMAYIINNGVIDQSLNRIYYKVTADIDLSERFWIPIGTESNPFDGTFILGKFKIFGANFAETYTELNWEEYCPGVFGFITDNAEIIVDQSMLPTIIIFIIIGIVAFIIILALWLVINNKKKKIKRLSENLSVANAKASTTKKEEKQPQKTEKEVKQEKMDADVQAILKEADAKQVPKRPAKPKTKLSDGQNQDTKE